MRLRRLAFLAALPAVLAFVAGCAVQPGPQPGPQQATGEQFKQASAVPGGSRQMALVVSDNWEAATGELRRFERPGPGAPWAAVGPAVAVSLGRTGLAWGLGLHPADPGQGPVKREGDGKAPAGVFALGPAFAYQPKELGPGLRMPVTHLTRDLVCVDDVASGSYNAIVDTRRAARKDWDSDETMRREDDLYRFGLVVGHNQANAPGAGSCIFVHIRRSPGVPTAGCTAMAQADILELIRWLDRAKGPVMVQLPRREYDRLRASWGLPAME